MVQVSLLVAPGMMSELKCESLEKFLGLLKCESSEKCGAPDERVGKLGRSSVWIGTLLNSSLELLILDTPADSLRKTNVKLSTQIKRW